jgi:hypothetical protein
MDDTKAVVARGYDSPLENIGRLMVTSVGAAAVVAFLVVMIAVWRSTGSVGDGFTVGAFVAVWAGPGLGVMAGGAVCALRADRAAHLH